MTGSRFTNLTRVQAFTVIAALVAAILLSVIQSPGTLEKSCSKWIPFGLSLSKPCPSPLAAKKQNSPLTSSGQTGDVRAQSSIEDSVVRKKNDDLILYAAITARVANGEAYYPAAAEEHRKGNYPLRPFITMRLPTLAIISASLGGTAMTAILYALALATLLAWRQRLRNQYNDPGRRNSALGLLLAGMIVAFWREFIVLHELWAGILLALAFGLHRPNKWLPSAMIAGCALFIRELSLPLILLMGAFAICDRRWREVLTLTAIVTLFALVMHNHAQHVAAVTSLTDPASPGWANFGGWQSFVRTMQMPSVLRAFPQPVGSVFVILSLFGWLSWRSPTGLFGTLLFAGYGVFFMALGRPDNFYWGFMVVPTFLIGLTFLPAAFGDLRAAVAPKLDFATA
jgi:hypothetical protein